VGRPVRFPATRCSRSRGSDARLAGREGECTHPGPSAGVTVDSGDGV